MASYRLAKRPPPALQPRLIDWGSLSWPVHERYEERHEEDPLSGDPRTRLIPRGRVRTRYQPVMEIAEPGKWVAVGAGDLSTWLRPLATGTDRTIAEWVREYGLVGIRPRRGRAGETTDEIREWVSHYGRCFRVLADVRGGRRSADELVQLMYVPINELLTVHMVTTADSGAVRLLPVIASHGPLSAAYQQLLGIGSLEDEPTRTRYHWRQPRACEHCGNLFRPQRTDQVYCKANCRKRAHDQRSGGRASDVLTA